jgi:hypothetical protein
MDISSLTVRDLRRRWKPHKERLASTRGDHPTAVRFHRACSWLSETETLDSEKATDQVLLFQWIAFNALYGQWDSELNEPVGDRTSWQAFLGRILDLDESGHIVSVLQEHKRLVLTILENAYLNRYFWEHPCEQTAGRAKRWRHQAMNWYVEERWRTILERLFQRIYLLRCQLFHGAATQGSRLNRTALRHCTTMMRLLMPAVLLVWIDHGADEDWGPMCYPPLDRRAKVRRGPGPVGGQGQQ